MTITIEVDDRQIMAALQNLVDAGDDLTPVMNEVTGVFREATQGAFDKEADPATGDPWADLSDVTKKRRAKKGKWPGKKLQVDGHLANIQSDYGADYATVFSPEKHAKTQQFGAKKGQFGSLSIVRTRQVVPLPWGDIPARPFFGLSDKERQEIIGIAKKYLAKAVR